MSFAEQQILYKTTDLDVLNIWEFLVLHRYSMLVKDLCGSLKENVHIWKYGCNIYIF